MLYEQGLDRAGVQMRIQPDQPVSSLCLSSHLGTVLVSRRRVFNTYIEAAAVLQAREALSSVESQLAGIHQEKTNTEQQCAMFLATMGGLLRLGSRAGGKRKTAGGDALYLSCHGSQKSHRLKGESPPVGEKTVPVVFLYILFYRTDSSQPMSTSVNHCAIHLLTHRS